MPQLNYGRHYHASCTLANKWVYVFAGITNATKKYCNSIERFDSENSKFGWEIIQVNESNFASRQGAGVAQFNNDEIIIFGGFSGEFLQDVFTLKHSTKEIRKIGVAPQKLFAYQMPTVFDSASGKIITADWQSKKVYSFD